LTCKYSERDVLKDSPLKSSQSLFVDAERLFTFQPGLHPCYYATVLNRPYNRARQLTNKHD